MTFCLYLKDDAFLIELCSPSSFSFVSFLATGANSLHSFLYSSHICLIPIIPDTWIPHVPTKQPFLWLIQKWNRALTEFTFSRKKSNDKHFRNLTVTCLLCFWKTRGANRQVCLSCFQSFSVLIRSAIASSLTQCYQDVDPSPDI